MSPYMKLFSRTPYLLFMMALVGCATLQSDPIQIEAVYLADRTSLPDYKRESQQGYVKAIGLAIQVGSNEEYRYGGYVLNGFCGETNGIAMLGDGFLYRIIEAGTSLPSGNSKHQYLIFVNLQPSVAQMKIVPSQRNGSQYDLRYDSREVCARSVHQGQIGPLLSNEIRISRAMIEQALREGVKPLPNNIRSQ